MYLGYSALLCMITIQTDSQVLSIIFLKTLTRYINMNADWPLRSLIIYRKLGPTIGNLKSVSARLNSGILLKKI